MVRERVIFLDIDGVLADCTHRLGHLESKDYKSFYDAIPLDPVYPNLGRDFIQKLEDLFGGRVVFLTGRPERTRENTKAWLAKHFDDVGTRTMLMRKNRDWRKSCAAKPEAAIKYIEENDVESCVVIDDQVDNIEGMICSVNISHPDIEVTGVHWYPPKKGTQ